MSIIYRNVWNEIRTQHFDGEDAILKALKLVSNRIYQGNSSPQSVNVFAIVNIYVVSYVILWRI